MAQGHEHYQQLAVGHVVGGLPPEEAASFRSHLRGCRDCRARVVELRGIATDLERAERDERARTVVGTDEAPTDESSAEGARRDAGGPPGSGIGVRQVTAAVLVVLVLAGAMAFWNLHLRTNNAVVTTVADQHARTLEVLASGISVPVEAEHPVRGLAAVDGEQVAVTLTGLDDPAEGERVVAWLRDGGERTAVAELRIRAVGDGTVAAVLDDGDAEVLELTLEQGPPGQEPAGDQLAAVRLDPQSSSTRRRAPDVPAGDS